MPLQVACIVEGHGEVGAAPVLSRRIAESIDPAAVVLIPPPLRVPKSKLLKPGELERSVELAARKTGGSGAVLVLLDSDDDCPAELGPALLRRATQARSDVPLAVVLAKREFEAWFLAAALSLRGFRGLSQNLAAPEAPEAIRGAKEWLSQRMEGTRRYVETLDQPALASRFDLAAARRADSFDKCFREIARLLTGHSGRNSGA
jgi:Domain of unknown function (DUF4276)